MTPTKRYAKGRSVVINGPMGLEQSPLPTTCTNTMLIHNTEVQLMALFGGVLHQAVEPLFCGILHQTVVPHFSADHCTLLHSAAVCQPNCELQSLLQRSAVISQIAAKKYQTPQFYANSRVD